MTLLIKPEWLEADGTEQKWVSEFKRVQKHLENALEYSAGMLNLQDILDAIAISEMQLWAGEDSAIVSQISVYPRKKILHLPFVGGNLEELERMAPSIVAFAKHINCDMITTAGRRGWERTFLRQYNFKPMHYAMYTEI
jgi:hypothetical protein